MAIKIGNLDITFKVGSGDCTIYLGDTLLYPQNQHDYSQDYFTIVSEEDNNTISLKNTGYSTSTTSTTYWKSINISASTDGGSTWSKFTTSRNGTATFGTINKGDKILLKSTTSKFSNTNSAYHYFDSTKNINVEGNILSLIYGDNFLSYDSLPSITTKEAKRTQQLGCIFKNNTKIISAKNMILPTRTLTLKCYSNMFNGSTSLVAAPSSIGTSATTLAEACCTYMFYNCTSLTTAPELPATTLANSCYAYMFNGCTNLTTAPELPATTLANYCYSSMFNGCTNLTTAPELPATTLANSCYNSMFYGCSSLTTAPELPATTLANYCYSSMFNGCTNLTTAPELPATTLANSCYTYMFNNCTSLTTAPELPATTLVNYCYNEIFNTCTNLNSITCLATDISATSCTLNWVSGVAASGTFTKPSSMNDWTTGVDGIPNGWTIVDVAPHTVIDYIQVSSDNTKAALVLDYIPTATSCYEIDMQTIRANGTPTFIGQKIDGTEYVSYQLGFCWYSSNTHWFYDYGGGRFSGWNTEASFGNRRLWRIGWQNNKLKVTDVNGTYVGGNNAYTGTFDPTLKLLLGGASWNSTKTEPNFGGSSTYLNLKVWGLKIYSEYPAVLVRDYIPVKKSDGTYTLYDTISKTYAVPYGTVTGSE